jgi:predicted nucleic acid-binding protein
MPVERIEYLPAGTRLFLDANIFVYAFTRDADFDHVAELTVYKLTDI